MSQYDDEAERLGEDDGCGPLPEIGMICRSGDYVEKVST